MKTSVVIAWAFWLSLFAMFMIEGVFMLPFAQSQPYIALSMVAVTALILAWVIADASENDVRLPMLLKIAVVAVAAIAVPYYKFRYFGARAGFRFLGILALCLGATIGVPMLLDVLI